MITASRKLFVLHLVANALLLWLAYEWLGVGESTRLRLVWSALDALAILALVSWFHGATLVFFRTSEPKINGAFRTALGHIPALLVAAILVLVLYGLLAWAAAASGQPAFRLASWLTLKLRTPVKPATVARIFLGAFWIVRWVVLPVGLLPMASGIAARGWRGFGEWSWRGGGRYWLGGPLPPVGGLWVAFGLLRIAARGWRGFGEWSWRGGWRYWLEVPLLLVAGLWLPFVLLGWVPAVSGFTMEMVSFSLRMLVAYLLFVGALWTLKRVTAARKRE